MSEQQWYCPNCGPEISVTVERMYELAIAAVKDGMSVADAAEKFMVDQAILACRLYA